jgi:hypothetical protein
MNRVFRRSADDAAEALLEAGRSQPSLDYDIELGLARHHDWLRSEAPVPEWATASVAAAPKSIVAVLIKTIVSTMLIGALATAAWQARGLLQPSAAAPVSISAPSQQDVAPSDVPLEQKPIPVPEVLPREQPLRLASRTDAHEKRAARVQRGRKEHAATRPASQRNERAESVVPAIMPTRGEVTEEAVTQREVEAAPEPKPSGIARKPLPQPASRAPSDLVEMQEVATAEQLLDRSPARALALVRQGDQRFAHGYFQQERAYIAVMALIRLGRIEEARSRAASFDKHFPALPYGARIHTALDAAAQDSAR